MKGLPTILGPTASGKTKLAAQLAAQFDGEIISADSRQVYGGMDIGTGKDLADFTVDGKQIPFHLIDIVDPSETYHLNHYQDDFKKAFQDIQQRNKQAVLVGGTGLYIEAVLHNYSFSHIPDDPALRKELVLLDKEELIKQLESVNQRQITFDQTTTKRLVRAIEICHYLNVSGAPIENHSPIESIVFGIHVPRVVLLERIRKRLDERLNNGMIEEVEDLIGQGITTDKLIYFGLEYKFITHYLQKELSYEEMVEKLNIAIRQFAKRQMTWFRRMERNGTHIHWIDGQLSTGEQARQVREILAAKKL